MSRSFLTIGRFAQLTGLTVRALRLYDEQGLLPPEKCDPHSGYRHYSVDQLQRGGLIARLRRLNMPLEEIGRFLDAHEPGLTQTLLLAHRDRLSERAAATATALRDLDVLMEELSMPMQHPPQLTSMVLKTLRDQPVLRIRFVVDESCDPAAAIDEVAAERVSQGLRLAGPPYFSCAEPDEEGVRHAEVGLPVDRPGSASGRVEPAVLPGGDVASILYRGDFPGIDVAYRQLWKEIEAAGLTIDGDPRDSYLTNPDATPDPNDYFTEVLWPVR